MINNIIRGLIYFIVFLFIQIAVLNNIHFLRIATPFLYLYIILKMPVGMSRSLILLLAFFIGLTMDMFSNTAGMHASACTFAALCRAPLINFLIGKDQVEGSYPSFNTFGYSSFFRYVLFFVLLHHIILFLVESLSFYDPLFMVLRISASVVLTSLLIFIVESFNIVVREIGGK